MPPKGDKEIVFFIVNVGAQPENGDNDYLEKAKEVMTLVATKKIFMRPKDEIGIMLGARTDIDADDEEDHFEFFQNIEVPTWEMVDKISSLRQTDVRFFDWHAVLSNSIGHIEEFVSAVRVVVIMLFDCDDAWQPPAGISAEEISERLIHQRISLLWMGSKPLQNVPSERLNDSEKILMKIVELGHGDYRQIDKALPQLRLYKKPKATYRAWKCLLEMGNIMIPTATYIQATDEVKKPSFKNVTRVRKDPQRDASASSRDTSLANETSLQQPAAGESSLQQSAASTPTADDDNETSGPREKSDDLIYVKSGRDFVDRHKEAHPVDEITIGYMYGRQFVPVPDADEPGMKYNGGPKSLKIFGFVPRDSIQLEDLSGDSTRIVLPDGPLSTKPFYCLAQAMADKNRVAIVRRIYAASFDPKMGILIPRLDAPGEPWCMLHIELLYAENRRVIQSRPLNSVMTHLSREKEDIVEDMINAMMLTDCTDDEGHELYAPGIVPSPNMQHLWDSVSFRAQHPDEPPPPMSEFLRKLIEPPESIKIKQEPLLKKLQELFPIEDELALVKQESQILDKVAVPVLSEVTKMEIDITKMKNDVTDVETDIIQMASDINENENDVAKGRKRKRSIDEIDSVEESNVDPDLEELFDADMSL